MIIPEGTAVYAPGGKAYRPGSDCPDRLITDTMKTKIEKGAAKFKTHKKSKQESMVRSAKQVEKKKEPVVSNDTKGTN